MGTKESYNLEEISEIFKEKGVNIQRVKRPIEKMKKAELVREVKMLEKLIELNMEDLWAVVEQRDKLYNELEAMKVQPTMGDRT